MRSLAMAAKACAEFVGMLRSGCRWKDAPPDCGPHKTLYDRFVRWAAKGVWSEVFHQIAVIFWL